MNEKRRTSVSKFLSLVLRHRPEEVGLELGENGWVEVDTLIDSCARHKMPITIEELREVVETSDKRRFAFDENGERIRANQGHSVEITLEFEERSPPDILFHGTADRFRSAILSEGLRRMARHHVHLSAHEETAHKVGQRHGKPMIFRVDAKSMSSAGHKFYISANGVWLVDSVPPEFLSE